MNDKVHISEFCSREYAGGIVIHAVDRLAAERKLTTVEAWDVIRHERPELINAYGVISRRTADDRVSNLRRTMTSKYPELAKQLTPTILEKLLAYIEERGGDLRWDDVAKQARLFLRSK